jgi:hypothetical protein
MANSRHDSLFATELLEDYPTQHNAFAAEDFRLDQERAKATF